MNMIRQLLLIALLTLPAAVRAEINWESGFTPGQAIILATEADKLTDSPAIYLFANYRLDSILAAGVEMGQSFSHKRKGKMSGAEVGDINTPVDGKNDPLNFTSDVKEKILWITPQIKIGRLDEDVANSLRPYGIVGGGFYYVQGNVGSGSLSGKTSSGVEVSNVPFKIHALNGNYVGINFGGGFTATLFSRFELGADVRYHYILRGNDGIQFLMPGARLTFLY